MSTDNNQNRKATPISGVASSSPEPVTSEELEVIFHDPVAANKIGQGTFVVRVVDFDLAVCLISAGVELREDPPYTHAKLKNGQHRWVFNFKTHTSDGKDECAKLIEDYTESLKYIKENPDCVFTGAMCALKNRALLIEHMKKSKPWIGFRAPGAMATHLVIEGSNRAANARAKGMVRCDPFEDQKYQMQAQPGE